MTGWLGWLDDLIQTLIVSDGRVEPLANPGRNLTRAYNIKSLKPSL